MNRPFGTGHTNPLIDFSSEPLAVVVRQRISSAGKMLLIALYAQYIAKTFQSVSQTCHCTGIQV